MARNTTCVAVPFCVPCLRRYLPFVCLALFVCRAQVGGRLTEMKTTLEIGDLQRTRLLQKVAAGERQSRLVSLFWGARA